MAEYQISRATRRCLIEAAGELFAEKGVDAVTTREIAAHAGTVQNAIAYHFGGIQGLIDAVWAYVFVNWEPGPFLRYLDGADELLKTKDGCRQVVSQAIRLLFGVIYQPDRPLWISKFLIRSALSQAGKTEIARTVSGSFVPALIELYCGISSSHDPDKARCWSLRILAAPMVFTGNLTEFANSRQGDQFNVELYQKLEEMTIQDALASLELA